MNYKGYFRSLENNDQYCVKIITDTASTAYTEVALAGDSPFVVTYNESATPFEPVRTSTAVIRMVHNDYLEDIYSPYAQGTQVKLENISTSSVEWVGYLVPRIYNQGYENCFETIEIEAADCISSLQYFDYSSLDIRWKSIVSIKDILKSICNQAGLLRGFYWTRSKKVGTAILLPEHLMISEQNFFSSDTNEPWKMSQVLEEICRYLGFTALQWREYMCFIDYEYLSAHENIYVTPYYKYNNYNTGSSATYLTNPFTITQDTYRGNGANISFEPIYNKVTVKDNFYPAEEAIPSIFEDRYLTNRFIPCNFNASYEITPETPDKPSYTWSTSTHTEKVGDSQYRYWQRPFNHQYWESHYYNTGATEVTLSESVLASSAATRDYAGATIMDLITAKNIYYESSAISRQPIISSNKDSTRYICISQKGLSNEGDGQGHFMRGKPVMNLKEGFKSLVPYTTDAYLVINYTAIFEKYLNRAYINPEWTSETVYTGWHLNNNGQVVPDYGSFNGNSSCGGLYFRVRIGDKWWWSKQNATIKNTWSSLPTSSTEYTFYSMFYVQSKWTKDTGEGVVQTDVTTLNRISWEDELGVEGYAIPLSGVNMTDDISIEIFVPSIQFRKIISGMMNPDETKYNAYCWVKDLTFKIVEKGQDNENVEDNDVVYENIINQDAVNELGDITVKLTTYTEYAKPAYSNVVYKRDSITNMLSAVREDAISGVAQKPEENIIEKYVKQYSTPTKKIQATQVLSDIDPFSKIYNADVENPTDAYVVLGSTLDYAAGNQTITMLQIK